MSYAKERQIQVTVILITLAWHIIFFYALLNFTDKDYYEPLHIAAEPQFIEYLLNSVAQQPQTLTNQMQQSISPIQQQMPPALITAIQQKMQSQNISTPDEDGYEKYELKNAVSYGSFTQGSIVAPGREHGDPNAANNSDATASVQPDKTEQETKSSDNSEESGTAEESDKQDQNPAPTYDQNAEQKDYSDNSDSVNTPNTEGQENKEPLSATASALALADEIVNNSGSSWITESQVQHQPTKKPCITPKQQACNHTYPHTTTTNTHNTKKVQLTLADITHSYIKQLHKEQDTTGHCTYNKAGSPTGHMRHGAYAPPLSGTALSEQIYASKLYNLLEQSAQAYSDQIFSHHDMDMETTIEVTIEKSGKILDVALKPTLPEKDMELALCIIVKKVGLFPPIPRQFHKQKIIMSIPIHIRSKQGFASYRLLYGTNSA